MEDIYQIGETLRITAEIADTDGDAAVPAAVAISIQKPDGTLIVDEVAMSSGVAGTYFYDYNIPDDVRVYRVSVKATGATGRATIEPDRFVVEEAI